MNNLSHVTTVKTEIGDLDALKAAVGEMKCQWLEGQKTYKWYGKHVGDYPLPQGFTASDMGKCNHAIRVPGVQYEVGVVKKGDKYALIWDFWGPGAGLQQKFGQNLEKLTQTYAKYAATNAFQSSGYAVEQLPDENGEMLLRVSSGW